MGITKLALLRNASGTATALACMLCASTALAQTAAPLAQPSEETPPTVRDGPGEVASGEPAASPGKDIIVTGSRLGRSSYTSPTPVNVIGAERLADLGISNVADGLNQLPAFRAATSPTANLFRVQASVAARTLDLRGLGPTRTLTLVDGRRFTPSSDLGTIDLNAIPSLLVSRSEVVTGGASAAYGADAVAGVVNIILDTKLKGIKADINNGISQQGDGRNFYAAIAGGTDFVGGRGHTVLGLEFAKENGVGDIEDRDWGRRHENYVSNPGWLGNGQPATIVSPNAVFVLTKGGLIPSGPLKGTQFNAAGQPVPFQFGNPVGGTLMIGGDPVIDAAYIIGNVPLSSPNQHFSAFSHSDFEITPDLNAVFELSFASVQGGPVAGADPYDFSKSIAIDNAYLPTATRAAMVAAGVTSIPVSRLSSEYGAQQVGTSDNKTYRVMVGLNGTIFGTWKWDGHYDYGRTDGYVKLLRNRVATRWSEAVDAVVGPGGNIVCRSTLTNPNNGCAPVNFFGINQPSAAAIAYTMPDAWQSRRFEQHDAAVNFRGSLFDTWAGPIALAVGGEFRRFTYRGDADPISQSLGFIQNYAVALPAGGQNVAEGYVEANLPLLKDSRLGKSLDVDGALRYTNYSITGSAPTWKVGAVYRPNAQFLFRVTRSEDIRAPAPAELSPLSSLSGLPLTDPTNRSTYFMNVITSGNPKLKLEKASTFTAGGVFQPHFLPRFSLSLDYYNIKIRQAIDILAAQATINLCASGNTSLCQFVTRDASTGLITTVTSSYQNLSTLNAAGYELSADYRIDVGEGRVNLSLNANYVDHLTTIDAAGTKQEFSNWTGNPGSIQNLLGVPRWRANTVLSYSRDTFGVTAEGRYIPRGLLDPTKIGPGQTGYSPTLANSISDNFIAARFYLDLSARCNIAGPSNSKMQVYFVVNNVIDSDPPSTLRLFGNPLLFDPIGRAFKVGVRANF